jgi:predicted patatin/cPLA2 family phospholipase
MFLNLFKKNPFPDKKVLVLEGGGMRGVFTTGVLQAFTDKNYFPWKSIIGSSAGALTGATYAARQIYIARNAFFSKLLTGSFISYLNLLDNNKHILNLDWMIDTIINGDEPLDYNVLRKKCPVYITATSCPPGEEPEIVYFNSKKDNLNKVLKATAALPFLYRGFVHYKDYRLLDGGILESIPYRHALNQGYKEDEILVVMTRPRGYRKESESFLIKQLYEWYYHDNELQPLVDVLENRYTENNKDRAWLENSNIDIIYPPKDFKVSRLTQSPEMMLAGFIQGVQEGMAFLKKEK